MEQLDNVIKCNEIEVRLAQTADEVRQAQKLRYDMLVLDFNDDNTNNEGLDASDYDDICSHLIAINTSTNEVVGTYRLLRGSNCKESFVCEHEFDIANLRNSGSEILELSRAVVHKDYRNGIVIKLLWKALFEYCAKYNVRYLFGTASFHGVDASKYFNAFRYLYDKYLVDSALDCPALNPCESLDNLDTFDLSLAKIELPSLIKGYLAMGSKVANGVYVDKQFGSLDVLTIMDLHNLNSGYIQRIIR